MPAAGPDGEGAPRCRGSLGRRSRAFRCPGRRVGQHHLAGLSDARVEAGAQRRDDFMLDEVRRHSRRRQRAFNRRAVHVTAPYKRAETERRRVQGLVSRAFRGVLYARGFVFQRLLNVGCQARVALVVHGPGGWGGCRLSWGGADLLQHPFRAGRDRHFAGVAVAFPSVLPARNVHTRRRDDAALDNHVEAAAKRIRPAPKLATGE